MLVLGLILRPNSSAFLPQLPLQILGEGADPNRAARLLRPERCWREIAKGLANASACLSKQHMRALLRVARSENSSHAAGIIALPGSFFAAAIANAARNPVELSLDRFGRQSNLRWLRSLGGFLPFGKLREQPFFGTFWFLDVSVQHTRPWPAQPRHRLQSAPRALTFGPIGVLTGGDHCGRCLLQQGWNAVIA